MAASPAAWPKGHVKGLKASGNFETEMFWEKRKLTKAFITSGQGGICRLWTKEAPVIRIASRESGSTITLKSILEKDILSPSTRQGTSCELTYK